MSHELEQFKDGSASFVSAREVPWHNLGTVVDHTMTAKEALSLARLDWEVKGMPVQAIGADGSLFPIEGKQAIYRDDPETGEPIIFSVLSERYEPVQNVDAFAFLDSLVEESDGAHYETAGVFKRGQRVFLTIKMPDSLTIDPSGAADEIQPYIMVTNGHDGSMAFTVAVTPIRVVCQNTLTMGLRQAERTWKTSHFGNVNARVTQARETLQLTTKYLAAMLNQAEELVQQSYTDRQFDQLVKKLYPTATDASDRVKQTDADRHGQLRHLFSEADTQANIRNTKWAAFNAVGEYLDWERDVRADDEAAMRARDSLFGRAVGIKQKALAVLS